MAELTTNEIINQRTLDRELSNQKTLTRSAPAEPEEKRKPLASMMANVEEGDPAPESDMETASVLSKTDNPAVVTFKNLVVTAKARNKVLLKGVSGQIRGGFWACMGPSGSGKSTLLNTLALRLDRAVSVAGELRLNGREYDNAELKRVSAYVLQDDVLAGNLTVEETLLYTAKLKCPQDKTDAQRQLRVDRVLGQVGLDHTRHTIVGSPLRKGISGGERKRLCVAMELLSEPVLLFLDEPTSGLDSVTALSLCGILRRLSETATIICTIHQPQSKIFAMFDNLILLKSGDIAYQGPATNALAYFEQTGYPCPPLTNPADHLLDSISLQRTDSSHSLVDMEGAQDLHYRFRMPHVDLHIGADKPRLQLRETTSWSVQFRVLLERSLKELLRNKGTLITQIVQVILMAVLIGTAFLDIGTSQASITKRSPVLFFCAINQGLFGALATINSFPGERTLSLRERAAGTYHASSYFCAKVLAETLLQLPLPIIFSCVMYFLVGLQAEASKFFIFCMFMVLCSLAATSLALMVSAICRTTDLSVTVLPMVLEISRLFGAFFLSPANTPSYFVWLDAISYVKYTYVGVSVNEYSDLTLYCTPSEYVLGPDGIETCPVTSGEQVLKKLGMDDWKMGTCAGILVLYIVLVRFFAYLGVRFIKH